MCALIAGILDAIGYAGNEFSKARQKVVKSNNKLADYSNQIIVTRDELNTLYFKLDCLKELQDKLHIDSATDLTSSELQDFIKYEDRIAICVRRIHSLENKISKLEGKIKEEQLKWR